PRYRMFPRSANRGSTSSRRSGTHCSRPRARPNPSLPSSTPRCGGSWRCPISASGWRRSSLNEMKAAFIERHGGPEVLEYGALPDPTAAPGEVVIDIVAASVNGADWKVRVGDYKQSKFPYVLGRDFSGVVSAVGAGVEDPHVGDAVFGVCEAGQEGAYAEKIAVKAAIVAKKPSALSHVNAAALALTGLTALSAIEDTLKLKRGE